MNNYAEKSFREINTAWWLLKISYGLVLIVIGADKFFDLITHWSKYISPLVLANVPLQINAILTIVAIAEILVGFLILTIFERLGSYIAIAWLAIVIVNLLSMHDMFDIAARDILIAIGIYAFILLTNAREILINLMARNR